MLCRRLPVRGSSVSTRTPTSMEVCQTALTLAWKVTSSPTWMGTMKVMRSMLAVTTRRRRVFDGGEPGGLVAQLHDRAAVHEAGAVGVQRSHPVGERGVRVGGGARIHLA